MKYMIPPLIVAALTVAASGKPAPRGDPVRGRTAFAQCAGCHSLMPGTKGIGPSLAGVVDRPVAVQSGYGYSKALLSGRGGTWTPAAIDAFLAAPNAAYPGNKMYVGVANGQTRADLIAYLAGKAGK